MRDSTVERLEREYGIYIDPAAAKLASAISILPFNDEDSAKNMDEFYSLLEKSRAALLSGGERESEDDPVKEQRLLEESCKLALKRINDDYTLREIPKYELKMRRFCIELREINKELGMRPDIWIYHKLTGEQEHFGSLYGLLSDALTAACFEHKIKRLQKLKAALRRNDFVNGAQIVSRLGAHPFFRHFWVVDVRQVAEAGSVLTGVPPSWLSSSLMPPWSSSRMLLKKYLNQEHAAAVLDPSRHSRNISAGRPLGIFLLHDPTTLYWEDLVRDLSLLFFGSDDLSLRLDVSRDNHREGMLSELFDNVSKRPFGVVLLEKVEQADSSTVSALCDYLTAGHNNNIDLGRTIFIIVTERGFPRVLNFGCDALRLLSEDPSRRLKDVEADKSGSPAFCGCKLFVAEDKAALGPKIWDLLDDVILLGPMATCMIMARARVLLRDIAASLYDGGLIIYPSEAALEVAVDSAAGVTGEQNIKPWLETNVVPRLHEMVDKGVVDNESIVFVDTYVGTDKLAYRVDKLSSYQEDDTLKKFDEFARVWKAIYEKGKMLENNVRILRKSLDRLLHASTKAKGAVPNCSRMEGLVKLVDDSVKVVDDIIALKEEAFGSRREKVDGDARAEAGKPNPGVESLRLSDPRSSPMPKMIGVVAEALLRKSSSSEQKNESPASFLLLGLGDGGREALVDELQRNFVNDHGINLLHIKLSEYSHEDSLSRLLDGPCGVLETVESHPYSILYFDQVELAHVSVFGWLVKMLSFGVSTYGSRDNAVDFGKTVVLISSDVGNKNVMANLFGDYGRRDDPTTRSASTEQGMEGRGLRAELLRKVDEIVVFNPVAKERHLVSLARIPIRAKIDSKGGRLYRFKQELDCLFGKDIDMEDKNNIYNVRYTLFSCLKEWVVGEEGISTCSE